MALRRARAPMRRCAAMVLALVAIAGCEDDQDPGFEPGGGQPATTSNTLGRCPPGGPDTTTPPAGCLGPDGSVLRP